VRNRRDGSVEVLVSGPAASVDDLVEACRQGPPAARVNELEINPEAARAETGFRQLPTV
jgi:acylphosphatase